MNRFRWIALLLALCTLTGTGIASAQTTPPPAPATAAVPISQDLLDSLLAPIALYPDQLLSQVLMASTYPLEVVEAARFVKANPGLRGEALDRALEGKAWDASVLSLCAFPQVLDMMDAKLEWTQRLGDAFLADEAAVMHTVQSLRLRAQQAGNLQSTPQQNVIVQERAIVIEPAQPEYVYVPVYNPEIIYGPWWAPAYRPWYWYPGRSGAIRRSRRPGATRPGSSGAPRGRSMRTTGAGAGPTGAGTTSTSTSTATTRGRTGRTIAIDTPIPRTGATRPSIAAASPTAIPGTAQRYRPANPGAVQTRESYRGRDVRTGPGYGGGDGRPGAGTGAAPGTGCRRRPRAPGPGHCDPASVRCVRWSRRLGAAWRWRGNAARDPSGLRCARRSRCVGAARRWRDSETATQPALGASVGAAGSTPPGIGATTRPAPAPQRPPDAGGTVRPAPSPARPGGMGVTPPPTAPRAPATTRPAPTTSQFATRSAPAASYPQPAYRPESRPQVQRDAARGAQSRAAMSQPAPQPMRSMGGGASRPSAPSAPSGGQRGGQRWPTRRPRRRSAAATMNGDEAMTTSHSLRIATRLLGWLVAGSHCTHRAVGRRGRPGAGGEAASAARPEDLRVSRGRRQGACRRDARRRSPADVADPRPRREQVAELRRPGAGRRRAAGVPRRLRPVREIRAPSPTAGRRC